MQQTSSAAPSPWLSMWYSPRRTIRRIVDTDPRQLVVPIFILVGINVALVDFAYSHLGDYVHLALLPLIAIMAGALLGMTYFAISSPLLHGANRSLGGRGSIAGVRAVYAWSSVPQLWGLLLWFPAIVLLGDELFTTARPMIASDPFRYLAFLGFFGLQVILDVWSSVLLVAALSEVEQFSIWRAIAAWLLFLLVIAAFACLVAFVVVLVFP